MNKAFLREPDRTADFCPRCGSQGAPVGTETLTAWLTDDRRRTLADPANFCPAPQCPVVYFDAFERVITAAEITRPVYPKDPTAPVCACFGLTTADIDQDIQEGVATRTKALLEKARSPAARCRHLAANGRSCVPFVQKYYLQCLQRQGQG